MKDLRHGKRSRLLFGYFIRTLLEHSLDARFALAYLTGRQRQKNGLALVVET